MVQPEIRFGNPIVEFPKDNSENFFFVIVCFVFGLHPGLGSGPRM